MNEPPWKNGRILTILICVFLSGAALGAIGVRLGLAGERASKPVWNYWKDGGRDSTIQRFKNELSLNPAQAAEFATVLDDFFMYYQTLQAQMDDVRATGKQRLLRILNEDQKHRFEKMMSELQSKQIR